MIVLVGFMGAGKTTVGRMLAPRLGLPFVDVDSVVAARAGAPITEIFEARGEPGFRELEREATYDALDGDDAVIALGGGALTDPKVCSLVQSHTVVHLDVGYSEAMRRIGRDAGRPMLERRDPRTLYAERDAIYRSLSHVTVATSGRRPSEVVDDIVAEVARHLVGDGDAQRVRVPLGARSYEVVVGAGVSRRIIEFASAGEAEKAFVVTHPELHEMVQPIAASLQEVGLEVAELAIPSGEGSKSLSVAAQLYQRLADDEAHRHDLLVTVGGGVVSDVGGFVASTYGRGMALVHVPTTLLGQVDAAIGGKTGVNLPRAKNLVGTIYQPRLVACDVSLLGSCPREEIASGLAEVAKYGFIADPDLLTAVQEDAPRALERDVGVLEQLVARSAAIKASFVVDDERDELGVREALNYGHTFAHALERTSGYGRLRHGEAVALGMVAAAHLARELGRIESDVVERHRDVLSRAELPTSARVELEELEEAWRLDKKYRGGVRFVILAGLGKPETGVRPQRDQLRRAVARLAT